MAFGAAVSIAGRWALVFLGARHVAWPALVAAHGALGQSAAVGVLAGGGKMFLCALADAVSTPARPLVLLSKLLWAPKAVSEMLAYGGYPPWTTEYAVTEVAQQAATIAVDAVPATTRAMFWSLAASTGVCVLTCLSFGLIAVSISALFGTREGRE